MAAAPGNLAICAPCPPRTRTATGYTATRIPLSALAAPTSLNPTLTVKRILPSVTIICIAIYATTAGANDLKGLKASASTDIQTAKAPTHQKRINTRKRDKSSKQSPPRRAETVGPLYANSPEAMQTADVIAQRLGLDAQWIRQAIGQAHYMPGIARAIAPPPVGTPKNWTVYRSRFIDPVRISAGVKFWRG